MTKKQNSTTPPPVAELAGIAADLAGIRAAMEGILAELKHWRSERSAELGQDTLYKGEEAAAYLGVTVHTLHKLTSLGKVVKHGKVGRSSVYTKENLDAYKFRNVAPPID